LKKKGPAKNAGGSARRRIMIWCFWYQGTGKRGEVGRKKKKKTWKTARYPGRKKEG